MMEFVFENVQRYLYIGKDDRFFLHSPHTPLDVNVGKRALVEAVRLCSIVDFFATKTSCPAVARLRFEKTKPPKPVEATGSQASLPANQEGSQEADKVTDTVKHSVPDGTVLETVQKRPEIPLVLSLIKAAIKNKAILRTDECLFALAYCAREFSNVEDRHATYEMVVELISCSRDLFQFLSYYMQLAVQSGVGGFGHGIRTAIIRWYEKHTPLELADMLASSHGCCGWTHKDVIAKVHLKLSCPIKQSLISAVMKGTSALNANKPSEEKGADDMKNEATVETTEQAGAQPSQVLQRYLTIRKFRSTRTVAEVLHNIKQHGMTLDMMPVRFKRSAIVWEELFPKITYRELLNAALPMQDYRMLKQNETNTEKYVTMLVRRLGALEVEQLHPIFVYKIAMLYENRMRYDSVRRGYVRPLDLSPVVPPNKQVLKNLMHALERSFLHHPKTGIRYYIALDLRKHHEQKTVFRSQIMSCFHASVMIAFSIFKREKHVTVVAFSGDSENLRPVQFTASMNWKQAVAHCQELLLAKTKVSLAAPIERAGRDKLKIDLFISITDSLIRVNPSRTPPFAALGAYREKMQLSRTRYLAISLSKHKPSFDFPSSCESQGMLEMVGYSEANAKIIEAFSKGLFN